MRVTSKGQVTIPVEIRKKAGLLPETEVEFVLRSGTVVLRKAGKRGRRGKRLIEGMRGRGDDRRDHGAHTRLRARQ